MATEERMLREQRDDAYEEIARLREALRRISVTRGDMYKGYLRSWQRCKDIANEALR